MPIVGRNTRVFGDRVLRSGKRFSTEQYEVGKFRRGVNGEDEGIRVNGDEDNDFENAQQENAEDQIMENLVTESISERVKKLQRVKKLRNADRSIGIVYKRKRKLTEEQRFGKKYERRKKLRVAKTSVKGLAIIANNSSCDTSYWIACFLTSVLSYMTRVRIGIRRLSAFLLSQPIFDAYSSHGMLFLKDSYTVKTRGVCIISGSRSLMPVFIVDISAIPLCFMQMHTHMYLRYLRSSCIFERTMGEDENDEECTMGEDENDEEPMAMADTLKPSIQIPFTGDYFDVVLALPAAPYNGMVGPAPTHGNSRKRGRKSAMHSVQLRNSPNIQKRQTSLGRKRGRGRPPSVFQAQKVNFPCEAPYRVLRSSDKRISTPDSSKVQKTNSRVLTEDVNSSSCSTNLLIIESDKCCREEGLIVTLQQSVSKKWFLAVKKGGVIRHTFTAEKVMAPPFSDRLTHVTVWTDDGSWKLEFPDELDWFIFKKIYKECSDRNSRVHAAGVIPIPRVQEVSNYADSNYLPYSRPDSYITMQDDELTRAFKKNVANYDMDSDDEEWLTKFNEKLCVSGELQQLTPDRFELIVDALEKGIHWSVDEYSDEVALHEMFTPIEPVRSYWTEKRKQKQSSVKSIFQLYKPGDRLMSMHVVRKQRSFRRRPSQGGRGKRRTFLPATAKELAEQHRQMVQRANAAADRAEEVAILKRQRAQKLMQNADLATYRAVMAIRIAEASQFAAESGSGTAASFLIG